MIDISDSIILRLKNKEYMINLINSFGADGYKIPYKKKMMIGEGK